jgi:hypothetical protein
MYAQGRPVPTSIFKQDMQDRAAEIVILAHCLHVFAHYSDVDSPERAERKRTAVPFDSLLAVRDAFKLAQKRRAVEFVPAAAAPPRPLQRLSGRVPLHGLPSLCTSSALWRLLCWIDTI